MTHMLRVLVRRISTPDETFAEGDLISAAPLPFDDDTLDWLLDTSRVEWVDDDDEIPCEVDGCEYSGTERGLSQHTRRSHADDGEES